MNRTVVVAAVALLIVVAAVLFLRRGGQDAAPDTATTSMLTGPYSNDSLGVLQFDVPPGRGWTLWREPLLPGRPVVTAQHRDSTAAVRLFVTPAASVADLNDVIRRRRDYLASLFSAPDLDSVVDQVLREETQTRDGYPVFQWQAVTEPADVAGEEPVRVLFMWLATLREHYAYEGLGLVSIPVNRPDQKAHVDSLVLDMGLILEAMRFE
jgi:hypothetical protein